MNIQKNTSSNWVGPLIRELELAEEKQPVSDPNRFRAQLEECQLTERIRQGVAAINREVDYQVLYLSDFLPPQRSVLRLSFSTGKTEYKMDIVLRASGPAVVFYSVNVPLPTWARYFPWYSRSSGSHIAFNQKFNPAEITDATMRTWFSFLLSRFNRKFNPGAGPRPAEILDFELNNLVKKASA